MRSYWVLDCGFRIFWIADLARNELSGLNLFYHLLHLVQLQHMRRDLARSYWAGKKQMQCCWEIASRVFEFRAVC